MDVLDRALELPPGARRIVRELRRQVLSGQLSPGMPLPSVRALASRSGLSVFPVHRALKHVEREGWATREAGKRKLCVAVDAIEKARAHLAGEPPPLIHFVSTLHRRAGTEPMFAAYSGGFAEVFSNCSIRHTLVDIGAGPEAIEQLLHENERLPTEVGYVLASIPGDMQAVLQASGAPCVVLGQSDPALNLPTLYEDMNHIGYVTGRILFQSQRVLMLYTGRLDGTEVHLIEGARRAAQELGRSDLTWEEFYHCLPFDPAEYEPRIRELLSASRTSLGVLSTRSEIAMAVVKWAHRLGIRIPEQLQVIAYSHSPVYTWVYPEITSVGPKSIAALSRRCAELLAAAMGRRFKTAPRELIESSLIERESTLPCRQD